MTVLHSIALYYVASLQSDPDCARQTGLPSCLCFYAVQSGEGTVTAKLVCSCQDGYQRPITRRWGGCKDRQTSRAECAHERGRKSPSTDFVSSHTCTHGTELLTHVNCKRRKAGQGLGDRQVALLISLPPPTYPFTTYTIHLPHVPTVGSHGELLVRQAGSDHVHASVWMTIMSAGGSEDQPPQADIGYTWSQHGGSGGGAAGSRGVCGEGVL